MIELYQFPISHYCEKVRWALEYKNIDYKKTNLLPGLHVLKTRKVSNKNAVPILLHDGKVIEGSSCIITHLDEQFPSNSLTPDNIALQQQALDWEKYIDKEIGIHIRRCCYHIILQHPDIIVSFFSSDGPWYGQFVIKRMFPGLRKKMRKMMRINDETFEQSKIRFSAAVDKLHEQYQSKDFLVGDSFSRADLTAAALMAPLYMPDKYGLNWPEAMPEKLQQFVDEFSEKTQWVHRLYQQHR